MPSASTGCTLSSSRRCSSPRARLGSRSSRRRRARWACGGAPRRRTAAPAIQTTCPRCSSWWATASLSSTRTYRAPSSRARRRPSHPSLRSTSAPPPSPSDLLDAYSMRLLTRRHRPLRGTLDADPLPASEGTYSLCGSRTHSLTNLRLRRCREAALPGLDAKESLTNLTDARPHLINWRASSSRSMSREECCDPALLSLKVDGPCCWET
mmetsp:Transcript_60353/g.145064  ORF Transcript_60353/g.145064 Transcript_60353/m.145064 type:complete len:210 (-) Transcript_60353:49-678(-)